MYHLSNRLTFFERQLHVGYSKIFYEERDHHILNVGQSYTVVYIQYKAALKR